jgi:MoaA/NifB/PqqE/SkfB family radical SAM enzyme
MLQAVLLDAGREGYNAVGISGGEPLLYPELEALLGAARSAGLVTTVTTNGTLLTEDRVRVLAPLVDFFAVSIDGGADSHNRIRASGRAYGSMLAGLDVLRSCGCDFGLIFTLTLGNLDELGGVVEVAAEAGAAMVQVHPLEEAGRAASDMEGAAPDDAELAYAWLEVVRLRHQIAERPIVHLDVASRQVLAAEPERGFAGDAVADQGLENLSPLVVEADGTVVPLQYGFGRRYALGNIRNEPFPPMLARWRREGHRDFLRLCRRVYRDQVESGSSLPFFNWYGAMRDASLTRSALISGPTSRT